MDNDGPNKKSGRIACHLAAILFGLAITVLGVGLSVTMVLLPIGIPVGLVGLAMLIWGLTPGSPKAAQSK